MLANRPVAHSDTWKHGLWVGGRWASGGLPWAVCGLLLATAHLRLLGWWRGRVSWPTWPRKLPFGEAGQGGLRMAGQREEPDVTFNFNSELYADPNLAEGVDYARRHRCHERFDDALARTNDVPKTTILAPHGGGIEPGTSELCLAVAGYHPANLPQIPAAGVTYDY